MTWHSLCRSFGLSVSARLAGGHRSSRKPSNSASPEQTSSAVLDYPRVRIWLARCSSSATKPVTSGRALIGLMRRTNGRSRSTSSVPGLTGGSPHSTTCLRFKVRSIRHTLSTHKAWLPRARPRSRRTTNPMCSFPETKLRHREASLIPGPSAARMTPISSRTIAALAEPFAHGGGPTHSTINLIWTEADASNYLTAEGSKIDRVLGGLRALRDGRHAGVGPVLQPDHEKLRRVAEGLASRLLALQLVAPDAVIEALNPDASSADDSARSQRDAGSPPAGRAVLTAAASEDDQHAKDQRKVMVIYGQDSDAARALFDWLRAVGLRPQEWGQLVQDTGDASPFIGQVLEKAFIEAQAVVALFTPDEHVRLRSELSGAVQEWRVQARPNVLFEAGMAFATHPRRTLLVVLGSQELPSDLAGRHYVRLGTVESLQDLAQRLDRAGCPVDLSGSDWLNTRRFPARSGIPATP